MSESSAATPGAKSSSEIPQTMKAVICHGPRTIAWRRWPYPTLVPARR
jgi:hypothetical protein